MTKRLKRQAYSELNSHKSYTNKLNIPFYKKELRDLFSTFSPKQPKNEVKGLCQSFCPKSEVLEDLIRNYNDKFDKIKPIKKFNKFLTTKTSFYPEEVRPIKVLKECFDYLMKLFFDQKINKLSIYKYIENRLRGIEFDISIQNLNCLETGLLLKKMIRFYLYTRFYFFEEKVFEDIHNLKQIQKIFPFCFKIYSKIPQLKKELIKYDILMNLNNRILVSKYYHFRKQKDFEAVFELFESYQTGNVNDFFYVLRELPFFEMCAALNFIYLIRCKSLNLYNRIFNEDVPVKIIQERLLLDSREDIFISWFNIRKIRKSNIDFYTFSKSEIREEDFFIFQKSNNFRKYLPLNLENMNPKNPLGLIGTPDEQILPSKSFDSEILRDLVEKKRKQILKIYLQNWLKESRKHTKKILIIYDNTLYCKSLISELSRKIDNKADFLILYKFSKEMAFDYFISIFIVGPEKENFITEKFKMLNKKIIFPQNVQSFNFADMKIPENKIKALSLTKLLHDKSMNQKKFILDELDTNEKNDLNVLEIRRCLEENERFEDQIVFYED